MEDVLCDLCKEVEDRWISLAKDLCGTHMMHTLLAEAREKKKKEDYQVCDA